MQPILFGAAAFPTRLCVILTSETTGAPIPEVPFFAHAEASGQPPGAGADAAQHFDIPLGTLATDHAGYISYDLAPLERRLDDISQQLPAGTSLQVDHLWLHPYSVLPQSIDALTVENVSDLAIVVRLMVDPGSVFVGIGEGFASIQAPSLTDWYLSPGSFSQ